MLGVFAQPNWPASVLKNRVAMRSLDDVRGTVREAGETLARTVRGLSIRLCNPSLQDSSNNSVRLTKEEIRSHELDAGAASATTLRWLIKNGLNQQCAEATGICLSCLVEIISVVHPLILQPLIPDLLKSLLFSMSGLEPAALNYLQARSGAHGADSSLSYENLERVSLVAPMTHTSFLDGVTLPILLVSFSSFFASSLSGPAPLGTKWTNSKRRDETP